MNCRFRPSAVRKVLDTVRPSLWFYEHTSLVLPTQPEARPRMLRWPAKVKWNAEKIQVVFHRLRPVDVHDCFVHLKDSEHRFTAHPLDESPSPEKILPQQDMETIGNLATFDATDVMVPFYAEPEPARADTYPQRSHNIGFKDIHDLLQAHHNVFLDFQGSVVTRLANIENKLTVLQTEVSHLKKREKNAGVAMPKILVKESPQVSLIRRIKARADRRNRSLDSPFIVFQRIKKKKITQESAEVQGFKKAFDVELQPSQKEELETTDILKSGVVQQGTIDDNTFVPPTIPV